MNIEEWLGKNNQIGIDIWHKKYQRRNETFDEWVERVSGGNQDVAQLVREKKFLFGGRILSNRGVNDTEEKTTLSNCYVIAPPEDNIESIYQTCSKLARTYSYGGGCGIDISKLSPEGARVHNQAKSTSGAVSFMDTFSQVTEQIGQNGRRGALMISIECSHPDLEKFITVKSDLEKVTSANISVRVTDKFMQAVKGNLDWELSFTRPETGETVTKIVKAKDIYHLLCENNWDYAEPGILFWDTISQKNLLNTNKDFSYAGTNPCAEEPLPAGGSCLLGSMNLSEFVNENNSFDFEEFSRAVKVAVKGLNEVLDEGMLKHPLQEQRDSVRDWRQIGLGIFGLADMLIKCGITYGSEASITLCDKIGSVMTNSALLASSELAAIDGSYPKFNCDEITKSDFFNAHYTHELLTAIQKNGLRNSQLLTIAPTGTLSTMLNISGGIEPIFANSYTRTTKSLHGKDVVYKVYTPIVQNYMEENCIDNEEDLPSYFVTSADIAIDERIAMQATWQKHIDASISSTVNLPEETSIEEVEHLYMQAWEKGLKGITIFRNGCKRIAILNTKDNTPTAKNEGKINTTMDLPRGAILECCNDLVGKKRKLQTGCGSLHVLGYFDAVDGSLQEVYLAKGSTGGCQNFMVGLSRTISLLCRAGVDVYSIKDQLDSTGACPSYAARSATKHDTSKGSCCPMAIGNALVDMYEEMKASLDDIDGYEFEDSEELEEIENKNEPETYGICPECGAEMTHEGGCDICKSCGYSHCS